VGVEYVAFGLDSDGSTTVFDATGLPLLTKALMKDGFDKTEIMAIMGINAVRALKMNMP
jgi:microsomal dipeptidase-like Zn-dependent dipeptidase